jgi:diaminohydroxyphosphoribosylaminopyrimidine deaminase/5-amino-6-(5-phosphoribosylamino)uracil reductase
MSISGYLPASGGLLALEEQLSYPGRKPGALPSASGAGEQQLEGSSSSSSSGGRGGGGDASAAGGAPRLGHPVISFYKAWDEWGVLSNFSPHPISVPSTSGGGDGGSSNGSSSRQPPAQQQQWQSVEHYYQAAKFGGQAAAPDAQELVASIAAAPSPEEAARIGRRAERTQQHLLRPDWPAAKVGAMLTALRAKFSQHAAPRAMLLATGDADLVEGSPHDHFWGAGFSGRGRNQLGRLLQQVRAEVAAEAAGAAPGQAKQLPGKQLVVN